MSITRLREADREVARLVECDGYAIVPSVLDAEACDSLIDVLGPVGGAGRRGLLGLLAVAELAGSSRLLDLVRPLLASEPRPVRTIYFDKSPEANWLVAWHQDLTLALRERHEIPDFGPWSVKEGIPHVQPPAELLARMITVRLHLDDADTDNGALRVISGSHRRGRLAPQEIEAVRASLPEVPCSVAAGDAMLMRPLLLHASGKSRSARRRRVLHIEYAGFKLPPPLEWHEGA
ncbi:MAG: phytanoyl-CoA dioxygenase family protein [Planctomycetales bacterium]|nr:phytanoyl-CoA dioxygenase family protein [Planctomycetales bacterium]MBN8627293.1 phytanoyl-CoA dioxygenase family protein [Planctomycetota bacterium]